MEVMLVADEVSRRLKAMFPDARYRLPSALGITPVAHDKAGNYNIKIGFGGYQQFVTDAEGHSRQLRKPQAFQLIARVIENGAQRGGFRIKARPFMSPAVQATRSSVASAMEAIILTVCSGYFPAAVSPESITAEVPS